MTELDKIQIILGDITQQTVDAVVNAANESLLGGGGVDGAIHRVAGPELLEECKRLGGCRTGNARITKGYRLPARYVIHAVGPVWHDGTLQEDEKLAQCYRRSLELAVQNDVRTIAFPSISTGAYGYPIQEASQIAVRTVLKFLKTHPAIQKALFVCFSQRDLDVYKKTLQQFIEQEWRRT